MVTPTPRSAGKPTRWRRLQGDLSQPGEAPRNGRTDSKARPPAWQATLRLITVDDDGRVIALSMRLFGPIAIRFRIVKRSRFRFGARSVNELRSQEIAA